MRLFIALRFSEEFRAALLADMDELRRQGVRGNYTRAENLHLTLAFLGECGESRAAAAALRAVPLPPLTLSLAGGGHFDRLYWAGIAPNAELENYAAALRAKLAARGIGFDAKPFSPHITLVRQAKAPGAIRLLFPSAALIRPRVSLMKSERADGALRYTELCGVAARAGR